MNADLRNLMSRRVSWLESPGPSDGVVVSTRVRLARNLVDFPFHRKLGRGRQQELVEHLVSRVRRATAPTPSFTLQMSELGEVERQALTERQLVSRELAAGKRPAALHVSADERLALMLNEEDHLRLQVLAPGLDARACLERAVQVDQALESEVRWAVHPRFGYLCACPTNAGTGMRASAMLHLPALAETQELRQVLRGLGKLHMTVRGLHGEGSEASGHFYQVSNLRSLGQTESEIVDRLLETVEHVVSYEKLARQSLIEHHRVRVEDRAWRAWGILTTARNLAYDELIDQLSWVRMGVALGLLPLRDWAVLDRVFIECQPAHLQLQHEGAEFADMRDRLRADLVRRWLAGTTGPSAN